MNSQATILLLAFAGSAFSQATPSVYTTYIGDASMWHVARIRSDGSGNSYVAGNRSAGALTDMFVAKLDGSGKMASFLSFGGNRSDVVGDMAIDPSGNLVLAGSTSSTSFPLYQAIQTTPGPGFVVKLDPRNNQFVFATYFPAAVTAVAVDGAGNLYLTGSTTSPDFPVTAGLPADAAGGLVGGVSAAFLTKLSAAGDRIVYSTRISGTTKNCGCCSSCFTSMRTTAGAAIAVDPAGNAYMAGNTDTADLPVTPGAMLQNGTGAFVAKINAAGTALAYLTYIGPTYYPVSPNTNPANRATAIAVDSAGSAFLAGSTFDPVFPATAGAYQTTYDGPSSFSYITPPDAFVLKLKPDGSGVVWATYLGGAGADAATSMALDGAGAVWLAGTTGSADFPNAQGWSQGGDFLAGIDATGAALPYCARYPTGTVAQSLAIDPSGVLHAAGSGGIVSAISPSAKPAPQIFGIANAAYGAAGGQMARGEVISIFGPDIGPATPVSYTPTAAGSVPASLGGVQVTMGSYALPLLYVSSSQINAVAPFSLYGSAAGLTLQVINNGTATPLFPFSSIAADPEVFQNPDGSAAAVNQDGAINSAEHPAKTGSVVSIWVTGVGTTPAYLPDGQIASGPLAFPCCTVYAGLVQTPANIVYSGSAPGAVAGIVQINFQLPEDEYAAGSMEIVVGVGGQRSQAVTIYTAQ